MGYSNQETKTEGIAEGVFSYRKFDNYKKALSTYKSTNHRVEICCIQREKHLSLNFYLMMYNIWLEDL